MTLAIIAALDRKRGIGFQGKLSWRLTGDAKHFRQLTTKTEDPKKRNAVIMGRKTWESLPEDFRPLPGRVNCVLTHRGDYHLPPGVVTATSLPAAIQQLNRPDLNVESVFVIGGSAVFAEAIHRPDCVRLELTEIDAEFPADTFFPDPPAAFIKVAESPPQQEHGVRYRFVTYERHWQR